MFPLFFGPARRQPSPATRGWPAKEEFSGEATRDFYSGKRKERTMVPPGAAYHDLLVAYAAAWTRHDLDAIMGMMTPDCLFETSGGPDPWGRRYEGHAAVRDAIAEIFDMLPDIRFTGARHFVCGERGVSEWTMIATRPDGGRIEARGCDLFEFKEGKIFRKDSYRKRRLVR